MGSYPLNGVSFDNAQDGIALVAETSVRNRTLSPSPSSSTSPLTRYSTSAPSQLKDHAIDDPHSITPHSRSFQTPRSLRGTWRGPRLVKNEETAPNHTYTHTSPSQTLPTPPSLGVRSLPISSTEATKQLAEDVEFGAQLLLDLRGKAIAVEILEDLLISKSFEDPTDEEEGGLNNHRTITCHGNTYLNLEPNAGCARWDLIGQIDPATTGGPQKWKAPTTEDHFGELDCPRCSVFEKARAKNFTKSRGQRESTEPLDGDAKDSIKYRRTGVAEYDSDYYVNRTFYGKPEADQLKQIRRFNWFHKMAEEDQTQWMAKRAAHLEREASEERRALEEIRKTREEAHEARCERDYQDARRVSDLETAKVRAYNKALYERQKALAKPKPRVPFEAYIDSLPTSAQMLERCTQAIEAETSRTSKAKKKSTPKATATIKRKREASPLPSSLESKIPISTSRKRAAPPSPSPPNPTTAPSTHCKRGIALPASALDPTPIRAAKKAKLPSPKTVREKTIDAEESPPAMIRTLDIETDEYVTLERPKPIKPDVPSSSKEPARKGGRSPRKSVVSKD